VEKAEAGSRGRDIVDIHAHYMPPELWAAGGAAEPMRNWSLQGHIDDMDRSGVARALLSITTPGAPLAGERGRGLVRRCNEYAAKIKADHRARFGFFTYVQLEDIEAALTEIEYGFDSLSANGVGLFTSYEGKLLGDPVFDPVFAELDRRKAIVFVHPTSPACCLGATPLVPDSIIEFGTDTSRAITNYVYGGAARRYPNVRMIFSHSGGTLPYLIERYDMVDKAGTFRATAPDGFRAEIAKFFFDVAQASNPVTTAALRKVVPMQQIVFGTDYPFRTISDHVAALAAGKIFTPAELTAIYRGNIAKKLPSLLS
jgi:predicted TIM-barrel fold metal-dependent hydrolase